MRSFWRLILVLAVPSLPVLADEPTERLIPDDVTLQLILLRQKSVQEELKVTPELAKKVTEFTDGEYEAWQAALKLGDSEREQKLKELEKKNEGFLADNLSEEQRKRLHQIALQVTGLMQLNKPEVAKALELTEEQQQKFKEMQKEAAKEYQEILEAKGTPGQNEKLAKLRAEIDKKVMAVLTEQQKEKAKEFVGEPFKGEILIEGPGS
jgi:hypothetical protein